MTANSRSQIADRLFAAQTSWIWLQRCSLLPLLRGEGGGLLGPVGLRLYSSPLWTFRGRAPTLRGGWAGAAADRPRSPN